MNKSDSSLDQIDFKGQFFEITLFTGRGLVSCQAGVEMTFFYGANTRKYKTMKKVFCGMIWKDFQNFCILFFDIQDSMASESFSVLTGFEI